MLSARRKLSVLISVVLCSSVIFSACGSASRGKLFKRVSKKIHKCNFYEVAETTKRIAEEVNKYSNVQVFTIDIHDERKPEVTSVSISGISDFDIDSIVDIENLLGIDYYHSGVVGLLGAPVEITYSDLKNPQLKFAYDIDSLRGISEEDIIVLRFNENTGFYENVNGFELDDVNHDITVNLDESESYGVYLLVDKNQWFGVGSVDVIEYDSDWERENDTGDIMELADKDWALDNAPNFTVSTPQELASVVYYVNAVADYPEDITVSLANDIDLSDYRWAPMGWTGFSTHGFTGVVEGNGFTISGMTIDSDYYDSGFVGYGMDVVMRNISFVDANVNGFGCVGIAGGEIYGTAVWENVHVDGTVCYGSQDHGGIVGREVSIFFKDCSSSFSMGGNTYDYMSFRQYYLSQVEVEEVFTLTLNDDYSITREGNADVRNLTWKIELDGVQVLARNADGEYTLDPYYQWLDGEKGRHTIYLTAFDGTTYVRVSNVIEYTIDN